MASKLCCTAEDESRTSSPELPNIRVTEATTPAKLPLLPRRPPSQNSLHELRQIFHNASDENADPTPPTAAKAGRARFIRSSVYSLHSLHKMKSMHSILRRKFSKDLSKKPSGTNMIVKSDGASKKAIPGAASDTMLKHSKDGPNTQLNITKNNIRKDLLTDKKSLSDFCVYDPDAEILDDVAKNIGKRTLKRPSIHSIDWSPSAGSGPTLASSSKSPRPKLATDVERYQILPQSNLPSKHFSPGFSTPNLRLAAGQERKLRRSHSATSIQLPAPSPLSPLRLPSLKNSDQEGVSWSIALKESLGLSQFPASAGERTGVVLPAMPSQVEIRVQEATSMTTCRPSASTTDENMRPGDSGEFVEGQSDSDDPRRSVHLYSMRISHHLRSGSLLSWDNLATASDLPNPPAVFRDRSFSDLSRISRMQKQHFSRHDRHTSSSGFASSKVPSKWGRVVPNEAEEEQSSIYSSRPQSPPDSFGGSISCLPQGISKQDVKSSSTDMNKLRRSNSYPTDNEDTPRPATRHGLTGLRDVTSYSVLNQRSSQEIPHRLARNNSVESTKKSKFREEFSPSPPKKRLITSTSIMKFLHPKRTSVRSQSEVMFQSPFELAVDGSLEIPHAATARERRLSQSLEAEEEALGKDKNAIPMWERALKNHQDERAAMFLPKNRNLAVHSSPVRERSGSYSKPRHSMDSNVSVKRHSAPLLGPSPSTYLGDDLAPEEPQRLSGRRTAIFSEHDKDINSGGEDLRRHYDQQKDTVETVGAWGRYPSHSRPDRTFSAGHQDSVTTRDFALEAAIKFAMGKNTDSDEDNIDPVERPASPPLLPGQKKRKKKVGSHRIAKSNSMTFGKNFLKNYARIFRSQSIEFQKYGYGHRSSITGGGVLEYPELEILPDVWRRAVIQEGSEEHSDEGHPNDVAQEEYGPGDKKGKGKLKQDDSRSTLRPLDGAKHNHDEQVSPLDGATDTLRVKKNARDLSAYYEGLIPAYPRASTDSNFGLEDFGGAPTRHSLEKVDTKRASMHSLTLPARLSKHSRNPSRMSRVSVISGRSARPSFMSVGGDDNTSGTVDERSIVSVRRSTMDLVTLYKEQENTERERVLSLMRAESRRSNQGLLGV